MVRLTVGGNSLKNQKEPPDPHPTHVVSYNMVTQATFHHWHIYYGVENDNDNGMSMEDEDRQKQTKAESNLIMENIYWSEWEYEFPQGCSQGAPLQSKINSYQALIPTLLGVHTIFSQILQSMWISTCITYITNLKTLVWFMKELSTEESSWNEARGLKNMTATYSTSLQSESAADLLYSKGIKDGKMSRKSNHAPLSMSVKNFWFMGIDGNW